MDQPEDPVIYRPRLMELLEVESTETIRRYIKDGKLPEPDVALSKRKVGWRLSSLHAAGIKVPA